MKAEGEGRDAFTIIGFLAVGATMVLVVLFLSQTLLVTPNMLYPIAIAFLLVLVMALVKVSYPLPPVYYAGSYVDREEREKPGADMRSDGEEDQYRSYLELKRLLIDRVMARRGMGREEWDRSAGDDLELFRLLQDEDLLHLVKIKERTARVPRGYRIEGVVLGTGFAKRFDYLLGKVERWQ